jgi:hypothetical protein
MSNMLTLMVADSHNWLMHQRWPMRIIARLFGVVSVYRIGYKDGWKAAEEVREK